MKAPVQTLKGFRDFLPTAAKKRQYVISALRGVFESYGFEPLETPALEYEEILMGKYGEEGDRLMYRFEDNGKRRVAMRYDQTVPLARVIAQYGDQLPRPFKRYQIQPVWRAENTQKGRYREFLQCDADIVGTNSNLADAEVLACIVDCLDELGFKNYKIKINSREAFEDLLTFTQLPKEYEKAIKNAIIRSIDKLFKIGKDEVINEILNNKRIDPEWLNPTKIQLLKQFLDLESLSLDDDLLQYEYFKYGANTGWAEEIIAIAKNAELICNKKNKICLSPTLARGLDYYSGLIFEVEIDAQSSGVSICGGGRYDGLVESFANFSCPAVGFAFGFDRIIEAMEERNLFPVELSKSVSKVLVTIFPEFLNKSLKLTSQLRNSGINAEIYLEPEVKIDKQLKYADRKNIPYAAILGREEIEKGVIMLKDLSKKSQEQLTLEQVIKKLTV